MKTLALYLLTGFMMISNTACKTGNNNKPMEADANTVTVPQFDADSAFAYVKAQVDFGPRVPNSAAHRACGEYLAQQLERYGAKVTNQYADLLAFDGTILKARNIIGAFNPENKKRILLFAHWDTRPWADNDPDAKNHHTPVDGANDGASGVGVLLEVARIIQQEAPALGIDIIFFDMEDYGAPQFYTGEHKAEHWALGAQHWARNPHVAGYNARFGILLDMVGGEGATFYREYYSDYYAKNVVDKVWKAAKKNGYAAYFVNKEGEGATDDHLFVNRILGIPSIDIIPNMVDATVSFGDRWHTIHDNMEGIDRNTLKAVGQTVLEVIYNEK